MEAEVLEVPEIFRLPGGEVVERVLGSKSYRCLKTGETWVYEDEGLEIKANKLAGLPIGGTFPDTGFETHKIELTKGEQSGYCAVRKFGIAEMIENMEIGMVEEERRVKFDIGGRGVEVSGELKYRRDRFVSRVVDRGQPDGVNVIVEPEGVSENSVVVEVVDDISDYVLIYEDGVLMKVYNEPISSDIERFEDRHVKREADDQEELMFQRFGKILGVRDHDLERLLY